MSVCYQKFYFEKCPFWVVWVKLEKYLIFLVPYGKLENKNSIEECILSKFFSKKTQLRVRNPLFCEDPLHCMPPSLTITSTATALFIAMLLWLNGWLCHILYAILLKVNQSVYIAKSRQWYEKTLNNVLLHVSNHALKDMYMLNYKTLKKI